ncbi:hypothetical protein PCC79_03455 [Propioniciclava soli]|uniref:Adhesin domain-containing protein n=1 Tax=Propioniciclava soli TaxID=2775081 RepID=A0ABZ3CAR9_9ACTN
MSEPDLSDILSELAAGRIDAEEASRRIDAARRGAEGAVGPEPEPEPAGPTGVKGTQRVSVRAVGRKVRVIADAGVATASVDGEHVLRRAGDVLEVTSDGDLGPKLEGLSMLRPPRSFDDLRAISLAKGLTVRVNPAIEVDVEVTAGSLATEGVPFLGRVRVTAGGARLTGARRIVDALVQAGSAHVSGPLSAGRSRVKVESGSLQLGLTRGANVTVRGEAQVGRIQWPGDAGALNELVVGHGSARLDLEVVMASATVTTGEDDR